MVFDPKTKKINREAVRLLSLARHAEPQHIVDGRAFLRATFKEVNLSELTSQGTLVSAQLLDTATAESASAASAATAAALPSAQQQLINLWKSVEGVDNIRLLLRKHQNKYFKITPVDSKKINDVFAALDSAHINFPLVAEELVRFLTDLCPPLGFGGPHGEFFFRATTVLLQPLLHIMRGIIGSFSDTPALFLEEEEAKDMCGPPAPSVSLLRSRPVAQATVDAARRRRRRHRALPARFLSPPELINKTESAAVKAKMAKEKAELEERELGKLLRKFTVPNKRRPAEAILRDRNSAAGDDGGSLNNWVRLGVGLEFLHTLPQTEEGQFQAVQNFRNAVIKKDVCVDEDGAGQAFHDFRSNKVACTRCALPKCMISVKTIDVELRNKKGAPPCFVIPRDLLMPIFQVWFSMVQDMDAPIEALISLDVACERSPFAVRKRLKRVSTFLTSVKGWNVKGREPFLQSNGRFDTIRAVAITITRNWLPQLREILTHWKAKVATMSTSTATSRKKEEPSSSAGKMEEAEDEALKEGVARLVDGIVAEAEADKANVSPPPTISRSRSVVPQRRVMRPPPPPTSQEKVTRKRKA